MSTQLVMNKEITPTFTELVVLQRNISFKFNLENCKKAGFAKAPDVNKYELVLARCAYHFNMNSNDHIIITKSNPALMLLRRNVDLASIWDSVSYPSKERVKTENAFTNWQDNDVIVEQVFGAVPERQMRTVASVKCRKFARQLKTLNKAINTDKDEVIINTFCPENDTSYENEFVLDAEDEFFGKTSDNRSAVITYEPNNLNITIDKDFDDYKSQRETALNINRSKTSEYVNSFVVLMDHSYAYANTEADIDQDQQTIANNKESVDKEVDAELNVIIAEDDCEGIDFNYASNSEESDAEVEKDQQMQLQSNNEKDSCTSAIDSASYLSDKQHNVLKMLKNSLNSNNQTDIQNSSSAVNVLKDVMMFDLDYEKQISQKFGNILNVLKDTKRLKKIGQFQNNPKIINEKDKNDSQIPAVIHNNKWEEFTDVLKFDTISNILASDNINKNLFNNQRRLHEEPSSTVIIDEDNCNDFYIHNAKSGVGTNVASDSNNKNIMNQEYEQDHIPSSTTDNEGSHKHGGIKNTLANNVTVNTRIDPKLFLYLPTNSTKNRLTDCSNSEKLIFCVPTNTTNVFEVSNSVNNYKLMVPNSAVTTTNCVMDVLNKPRVVARSLAKPVSKLIANNWEYSPMRYDENFKKCILYPKRALKQCSKMTHSGSISNTTNESQQNSSNRISQQMYLQKSSDIINAEYQKIFSDTVCNVPSITTLNQSGKRNSQIVNLQNLGLCNTEKKKYNTRCTPMTICCHKRQNNSLQQSKAVEIIDALKNNERDINLDNKKRLNILQHFIIRPSSSKATDSKTVDNINNDTGRSTIFTHSIRPKHATGIRNLSSFGQATDSSSGPNSNDDETTLVCLKNYNFNKAHIISEENYNFPEELENHCAKSTYASSTMNYIESIDQSTIHLPLANSKLSGIKKRLANDRKEATKMTTDIKVIIKSLPILAKADHESPISTTSQPVVLLQRIKLDSISDIYSNTKFDMLNNSGKEIHEQTLATSAKCDAMIESIDHLIEKAGGGALKSLYRTISEEKEISTPPNKKLRFSYSDTQPSRKRSSNHAIITPPKEKKGDESAQHDLQISSKDHSFIYNQFCLPVQHEVKTKSIASRLLQRLEKKTVQM